MYNKEKTAQRRDFSPSQQLSDRHAGCDFMFWCAVKTSCLLLSVQLSNLKVKFPLLSVSLPLAPSFSGPIFVLCFV